MNEPSLPPESAEPTSSWRDLPVKEQVAAWKRVVPDSPERILRQVEADYEHRRNMDRIDVRFRIFGACLASTCCIGLLWMTKYLVDHHAAVAGAGLLGTGIAGIVGIVMRRDRRQK
jgi:uncharacterized membrane protein